VTFKTPSNQCQYLLAKDCSAQERFAVFAQQLDGKSKTKSLTILTAGSEIKLLPPQQQNVAQVVVDGRPHELTFRKAITLQSGQSGQKRGQEQENQQKQIRIYLRATPSDAVNPIIVIQSDINDLEIKYDGKNAKIELGPQYKGKTCGLCGDNNDESEEEFSGPDQCIYESAQDFANSYALSGQHCEQSPHQQFGAKRCPAQQNGQSDSSEQNSQESTISHQKQVKQVTGPNGQTTLVREQVTQELSPQERANQIQTQANIEELQRSQQQQQENQMARQDGQNLGPQQRQALYGATPQQQKIIQRLRTQYIERDDMVCFTTKPVLACVSGRASRLQAVKLDFHCLPKTSPFTQQLIVESERQVIKQLLNKRVDLRQAIDVPVACVAA